MAHAAPGLDQTLDGGGATASVGAVRLNGEITAFGLPGGLGSISGNSQNNLAIGFYPSLSGLIGGGFAAASDVWLQVSEATRGTLRTTTAWLRGGGGPPRLATR